jgi:hypothetical protein
MATVNIVEAAEPYYTIEVSFGGHVFVQQVVSSLKGSKLVEMLDSYGSVYESEFVNVTVTGTGDD